MAIPAVVAAGDRGAARAVYGESKAFLEIGGRPLVVHVVSALQRVSDVSEVWVVGDAARLRGALAGLELAKPLHVLDQFENLYQNAWQSYRRLLPCAGPQGRDPGPEDEEVQVLYVSGDLPFATPHEIADFVRQAQALDCDYALGLVTEASMAGFLPAEPGAPGIRMATFNLREGRFRQSNLHLVRPARVRNRSQIDAMYRHRQQRRLGAILRLAWRVLRSERGGWGALGYFALLHLAGVTDRWGWRRVADAIRRRIRLARIERGCSDLLGTRFRFVVTRVGGCAVDIDNEADCDAARACFERWRDEQREAAERLLGSPAGPDGSAS